MRWALIGLLVLPLLTGCAGRSAAPASDPVPSELRVDGIGVARTFSPEELRDLETLARGEHVPLRSVLAAQRGSAEFRELANRLEGDAASGLVMAWRTRTGEGRTTFTHRPTDAVLAALRALPIDTRVRWGLPLAHDELVRFSDLVSGSVQGVAGAQPVWSGPTTAGDAVEVHWFASGGSRPSEADLRTGLARATSTWPADRPRVPVRFIEDDGPSDIRPM